MQQVKRFKINGKENMETYTFRVLDTLLVEKKIWAVIRDLSCNWCQTTFTSEEEFLNHKKEAPDHQEKIWAFYCIYCQQLTGDCEEAKTEHNNTESHIETKELVKKIQCCSRRIWEKRRKVDDNSQD